MYLLRLVFLNFNSKPPKEWREWKIQFGEVELKTLKSTKPENRLLIVAQIPIGFPEISDDNHVIVPKKEQKLAEETIETVANMISVATKNKRSISSPTPCIALYTEDEGEYSRLEETKGFLLRQCEPKGFISAPYTFTTEEISHLVKDRRSGLAIMAEAIGSDHLTGRFHEYQRLFELAFNASSSKLVKLLHNFLKRNNLNYTRGEIKKWLIKLRHPATHADLKKTDYFVLERDIQPIISRMEQAAYDVLMNKKEWHSHSIERRSFWTIPCGTKSSENDLFIVKGNDMKLQMKAMDHLCSYTLDLEGVINRKLDKEWWYKEGDFDMRISGKFQVLPDPGKDENA